MKETQNATHNYCNFQLLYSKSHEYILDAIFDTYNLISTTNHLNKIEVMLHNSCKCSYSLFGAGDIITRCLCVCVLVCVYINSIDVNKSYSAIKRHQPTAKAKALCFNTNSRIYFCAHITYYTTII